MCKRYLNVNEKLININGIKNTKASNTNCSNFNTNYTNFNHEFYEFSNFTNLECSYVIQEHSKNTPN